MPRVDRRTFLALGACGLLAAGCTGSGPGLLPDPGPSGSPDPDAAVRAGVADSERALVAAYRATIAAMPELAEELAVVLAQHEEHLARIVGLTQDGSASPGTATAGTSSATAAPDPGSADPVGGSPDPNSTSPSPNAGSPTPTGSGAPSLTALARQERAASRQRTDACDEATGSALARDLCLIAASEAQHAVLLAGLAEKGR